MWKRSKLISPIKKQLFIFAREIFKTSFRDRINTVKYKQRIIQKVNTNKKTQGNSRPDNSRAARHSRNISYSSTLYINLLNINKITIIIQNSISGWLYKIFGHYHAHPKKLTTKKTCANAFGRICLLGPCCALKNIFSSSQTKNQLYSWF